jgi:hypothetical protein
MITQNIPNTSNSYHCEKCNYNTGNKKDYRKHLLTRKHVNIINDNDFVPTNPLTYTCLCGKSYKHKSGLSRHKTICNRSVDVFPKGSLPVQNESTKDKDMLILELLKQNSEFQLLMTKETTELRNIISEQNQKMMEMAGNMGSNNNINSHNKFNLNVFLNEKCKNAMTLTEFVESINLSVEDFIQTGERGFIDGISNIIVERINSMDLHDRPLHCTDLKREIVYIKDIHRWEKDDDKDKLRKAVKGVAYKNERMRPIWYEETPEVDILGSANCDKFLKYSESALGGYGKEQTKQFEDKVMRNILKETVIDKNRLDN